MFMFKKKLEMPSAATALPGRTAPIPTASHHFVNGRPLKGPYPEGFETAIFGLGCFWRRQDSAANGLWALYEPLECNRGRQPDGWQSSLD